MADQDISVRISGDAASAAGAIDQTADKLGRLGSSAQGAGLSFGGLLGNVSSLALGAAGLAGAAGAVGAKLVGMVGGAMDAADRLGELAQSTGVSVVSLSRWEQVAKNSGTSVEELGKSMGRMNVKVGEAVSGNEQARAAFASLGLSLGDLQRMRPEEVFRHIAEQTKNSGNASGMAAELNAVFGKSFMNLVPLLNQGVEGLDAAAREADAFGTTLSDEVVARADQTSDSLGKFGQIAAGLGRQVMAEVAPTIKGLADRFGEFVVQSGFVKTAGEVIAGVFNVLVNAGQVVAANWRAMSTIFGGVAEALLALGKGEFQKAADAVTSAFTRSKSVIVDAAGDIKAVWTGTLGAIDYKKPTQGTDALRDASEKLRLQLEREKEAKKAAERAAKDLEEQKKRLEQAYQSTLSKVYDSITVMRAEIDAGGALTASQRLELETLMAVRSGKLQVTSARWEEIRAGIEEVRQLEAQKAAMVAAKKADEEAHKQLVARIADQWKSFEAIEALARKIEDENALLGLSKDQLEQQRIVREEATLATMRQALAVAELQSASASEIEAIRLQIEAQERLIVAMSDGRARSAIVEAAEKSRSEWAKAAEGIESSLTDALMRGFESGKDFAQTLVDTAKNLFQTLVLRPTIQAVVQPLAAGATGILGSLGLPGTAGAVTGAASGAPGLLGNALSLFGAGGLGGSVLAGAGWLTGATSLTGALSAAGSLIGTGSGAGILSGLGMGLGALGPIAVGALALASLFGGKGGGPKVGGSSVLSLSGDTVASGDLRLYTPNDADAQAFGLASSALGQIRALASAFGGSADGLALGLGFDTDPQGTAGSRITSFLTRNGVGAYSNLNQDFGRDEEALKAGLSDEVSKLVVAGLQASNLSGRVGEYFAAFDLAEITGDQARAAIEAARSAQGMAEAVRDLGGVFATFDGLTVDARSNLAALTGGLDAFVSKTQSYVANYFSEEEQAGIAAASVLRSLGAAGIDASSLSSKEGFRSLLDTLDLSTASGQSQFAALLNTQGAFAGLADQLGSGTTLADLAALSPGGAAYEVLVGTGQATFEASTTVAENTGTMVELLRTMIDQNGAVYQRLVTAAERIEMTMTRAESTAALYGAAGAAIFSTTG